MFKHFVLTLDGNVQSLLSLIANAIAGGPTDIAMITLTLQPGGANANPIFVGSAADITSSDYGYRLEAAAAGVPPAPFVLEFTRGVMRLSQIYVKGTATETLHVSVVAYQ